LSPIPKSRTKVVSLGIDPKLRRDLAPKLGGEVPPYSKKGAGRSRPRDVISSVNDHSLP